MSVVRPPRDGLYRALWPSFEVRADQGEMPTLAGHFVVWNDWTEINSLFEGHFMERFSSGSARKTIRERRGSIRSIFQHGFDPFVGDKPLGPFDVLREDAKGVNYEVPLLDTAYNRELIPGLEAGVYGASFKFRVIREEWNDDPGVSEHNPKGLPERDVKEFQLFEGGPVTFPAYESATAGLRSVTDVFLVARLASDPKRLRELVTDRDERRRALLELAAAPLGDEDREGPDAPESALPLRTDLAPSDDEGDEDRADVPEQDNAPAEAEADASRDDVTPEEPAEKATPRKPSKDYLNPKEDRPAWSL